MESDVKVYVCMCVCVGMYSGIYKLRVKCRELPVAVGWMKFLKFSWWGEGMELRLLLFIYRNETIWLRAIIYVYILKW